MHDRQSVENILTRLMPPALSPAGQSEIDAMIDDLAGELKSGGGPRRWPLVAGGIAATLAAGFMIAQSVHRNFPQLADAVTIDEIPGFTVVSESGRVEDMVDVGWTESPDGGAMRTLRLRVVEESRLLDLETGIVMNISQPREEFLLMPVSTF
jgi:hypothetical protein